MTPEHGSFSSVPSILFNSESIDFELSESERIIEWLESTIAEEKSTLGALNFIFCSDDYLHQINIDYLQHDTYTDVISFPYSDELVEGDIFISIDRIRENAKEFGVTFDKELHRVMVHGTLHLIGYGDKDQTAKKIMTEKEDHYLDLLSKLSV